MARGISPSAENRIEGEGQEANLQIRRTLLNFLGQGQHLDRSLVSLDSTLLTSQELTKQTGYSGKQRLVGTKLSPQVDRARILLFLGVDPGNYHDGPLRVLTLVSVCKPLPIRRDILPNAAQTTVPTLPADKGSTASDFGSSSTIRACSR